MISSSNSMFRADSTLVVFSAFFLALFFGLAASFLPWFYVAVLILPVAGLLVLWKFPVFALLPYLCFSYFISSFKIIDVVSVLVILTLVFKALLDGKLRVAFTRQFLFLYIIVGISVLAFIYGYVFHRNSLEFVYREARVFIYLAFTVPLVYLLDGRKSARSLVYVLVAFGLVISFLSVFQALTKIVLVSAGRVGSLDGVTSSDTVRVQIPGFPIVMFSAIFLFSLFAENLKRAYFAIPVGLVLMAGLIFNYGRALWFWTAVGVLICSVHYKLRGISIIVFSVVLGAAAFFSFGDYVKPHLVETVVDRIESTFQEGGGSTSLGWRQFEIGLGVDKLKSTYGMGVGLGGEYRVQLSSLGWWEDYSRYTHNTYLFFALKLSVFGLLAYLSLLASIAYRANLSFRQNIDRPVSSAVFSFMLAFLGLGFTQPELMTHYGTTLLAFLMAIVLCLPVSFSARKEMIENSGLKGSGATCV